MAKNMDASRRIVGVSAYENSHGTITRAHQRQIDAVTTSPDSTQEGLLDGLMQIQERQPRQLPRQPNLADYENHDREYNQSMNRTQARAEGLATPMGFTSMSAAMAAGFGLFVGVLPMTLIAAPIAVGSLALITVVNPINKALKRRKQRKGKEEMNPAPNKKDLDSYVADYPWDASPHRQTPPQKPNDRFYDKEAFTDLNSDGVGTAHWKISEYSQYGETHPMRIHPYANLSECTYPFYMDLRGANIGGGNLSGSRFSNADMTGANLENVNAQRLFFTIHEAWTEKATSSLRGANCKGADFSYASLLCADMSGADVTDANFTGATLPTNFAQQINITSKQYASLNDTGLRRYNIPEANIEDVINAIGGNREELGVSIWAGDIQVLERETHNIVEGSFDKEKHFIPQWELVRLQQEKQQSNKTTQKE